MKKPLIIIVSVILLTISMGIQGSNSAALNQMNQMELMDVSKLALNTNAQSVSLDKLDVKAEKAKVDEEVRLLSEEEAKNIVNDNLSGIVDTFTSLGEKHNWSFENLPDFTILRPNLLKYASESFTDGFLKEVKDDFYCSCDMPPYPYPALDIRFTLHENTSNRIVASSIEFDQMVSSGSTVYFTLIKENGKWVMDNYRWVSLDKEPINLEWEEVKANLEKDGTKVQLLHTTKYDGEKIYIIQYGESKEVLGVYADNTGYLWDVPPSLLP